jgi:hypothetical protein
LQRIPERFVAERFRFVLGVAGEEEQRRDAEQSRETADDTGEGRLLPSLARS